MPQVLDLLALLALASRRAAPRSRPIGPVALDAPPEAGQARRRRSRSCPEYDRCLDLATRRGWRSWACGRCPLHARAGELGAGALVRLGAGRLLAGEA